MKINDVKPTKRLMDAMNDYRIDMVAVRQSTEYGKCQEARSFLAVSIRKALERGVSQENIAANLEQAFMNAMTTAATNCNSDHSGS